MDPYAMDTKVTAEAENAIVDAVARSTLAVGAGLRVWKRSIGGEPTLVTGLVEGPTPLDIRLPDEEGLLFVDPDATDVLDGKVIDLQRSDEGVALVVIDPL